MQFPHRCRGCDVIVSPTERVGERKTNTLSFLNGMKTGNQTPCDNSVMDGNVYPKILRLFVQSLGSQRVLRTQPLCYHTRLVNSRVRPKTEAQIFSTALCRPKLPSPLPRPQFLSPSVRLSFSRESMFAQARFASALFHIRPVSFSRRYNSDPLDTGFSQNPQAHSNYEQNK